MTLYTTAKIEYRYGYAEEHEQRAQLPNGEWTSWYPTICKSDCFKEWHEKTNAKVK